MTRAEWEWVHAYPIGSAYEIDGVEWTVTNHYLGTCRCNECRGALGSQRPGHGPGQIEVSRCGQRLIITRFGIFR